MQNKGRLKPADGDGDGSEFDMSFLPTLVICTELVCG